MENYKQKYKEALERATKLHSETEYVCEMEMLEQIFPELKESERIRREILEYVRNMEGQTIPRLEYESWIAWLEKQGENKPVEWSKEDEESRDIAIGLVRNADDCSGILNKDRALNWLKSLRPSWKPTKEQLDALKYFVSFHQPQANAAVEGWEEFESLESLYEQLEKL